MKRESQTSPMSVLSQVMGIVNVTPDSFSDGGRWTSTAAAVDHAMRLVEQGADGAGEPRGALFQLAVAIIDLRFMIQDLRITINNKNICGGHCGSTSPSNEGGR